MITFEEIQYKNFLSVGNSPITIKLNRSPTTLITGSNGSGKSTLVCALTYALFGKSYRGVPKSQIPNTVNQRDCVVRLKFKTGTDNYEIVRGIKPSIFDIYKNDSKLNNDAAVRDQQKFLEETILNCNFKSTCQIAVIGTATYIPFMKLSASARREFIENLLGISVFSDMNRILKGRISVWKNNIDQNKSELASIESQIKMQRGFIDKIKNSGDEIENTKKKELEELKDQAKNLKSERDLLEKEFETLLENEIKIRLDNLINEQSFHKQQIAIENSSIDRIKTTERFFEQTSVCSTCSQDIDPKHAAAQRALLSEQSEKHADSISEHQIKISAIGNSIKAEQIKIEEIQKRKTSLALVKTKMEQIARSAKVIIDEIDSVSEKNKNQLQEEHDTLSNYLGKRDLLIQQQKNLLNQKEIYDQSYSLLRDTGIKSKIIRQYIPVVNNAVNRYLSILGFQTVFELDENFNETLKARYKDEFTYNNLSMGERQRLDLAITFAWRDVAKQKNSANMNVMFLDETFDSSLDSQGTEDLSSILKIISKNNNVFVISHKGLSDDMFRSTISFEKRNGFTRMA